MGKYCRKSKGKTAALGAVTVLLAGLLAAQTVFAAARGEENRDLTGVQVRYHGTWITADPGEDSYGTLFSRMGIRLEDGDWVSRDPEAPAEPGTRVRIQSIVTETQAFTRCLPRETLRCDSPQLPRGMERILREGSDGAERCSAEVTYIDGREVERKILESRVVVSPVARVVAVGTAPMPAQADYVFGEGYIRTPEGQVLHYSQAAQLQATAYTHTDRGCDHITATGTLVQPGTVAVDPEVIPYGTRMFIMSTDGKYIYGISTAEDCGGGIRGERVDLYFPNTKECIQFGRRDCIVYFLEGGME